MSTQFRPRHALPSTSWLRLHRKQRIGSAIFLAALSLSLVALDAGASLCPGGPGPGQVQIGVANGPGFGGAPICAPDPNAAAADILSAHDDAAFERDEAAAKSRDILRANIEGLTRSIEMMEAGRRSMEGIDPNLSIAWLKRDPAKGWWEFPDFTAIHTSEPGEFCSVMFVSAEGLVGLHGPGGDYRGAMLTFWGEHVPMPAELQLVDVSLAQNDDAGIQTVTAYNYSEAAGFGVIALSVPTIEALLGTMQDEQSFRVSIDGRQVVNVKMAQRAVGTRYLAQLPCVEAAMSAAAAHRSHARMLRPVWRTA